MVLENEKKDYSKLSIAPPLESLQSQGSYSTAAVRRQWESDIRIGHLDPILEKLEKRGLQFEIAKYVQMRELRIARQMASEEKLDRFQDFIIDSSQLRGARVLVVFVRQWKARKEAKQLEESMAQEEYKMMQFDNYCPWSSR